MHRKAKLKRKGTINKIADLYETAFAHVCNINESRAEGELDEVNAELL